MLGEPVAYNEQGRPVIVRQVDDDGQARTICQNEDGSLKVFGVNTVSSLLSSKEVDAKRWVGSLSDRQIRALVHEFGHRLVHTSRQYTAHRSELEHQAKRADYAYFGLSEGATEKDLSVAYRKMAKRMHPDKNGGTEEAKRRFQAMKERYEHLKESYHPQPRASASPGPEPETEPEKQREQERERGDEERQGEGAGEEDGTSTARRGEEERQSEEGEEQPGASREESGCEAGASAEEAGEEDEEESNPRGDKVPPRQEAYDEDEDDSQRRSQQRSKTTSEEDKRIEYDPHDRDSLDKTVWKMLGQMRRLQQSIDNILGELRRTRGG